MNPQQAWHHQVLREVIKNQADNPRRTKGELSTENDKVWWHHLHVCPNGAEHLTHRKIRTFPFCLFLVGKMGNACSSICFDLFKCIHIFFSCHVAFTINTEYCHIFHPFLCSCYCTHLASHLCGNHLCCITILFYISVLLHWDCVEMWLYRVDSMPSSAECS